MADKEKKYTCAYSRCLHHGEKVKASESVVIGRNHYHWDCAELKQKIKECIDLYIGYAEDESLYPVANRIINNLIFTSKVPVDYMLKTINLNGKWYKGKPAYVLYGLRTLFYEKEFRV